MKLKIIFILILFFSSCVENNSSVNDTNNSSINTSESNSTEVNQDNGFITCSEGIALILEQEEGFENVSTDEEIIYIKK